MKQIKLDDKRDLAIEGNEAWIVDYSDNPDCPRNGIKHTFTTDGPAKVELTTKGPNLANITYHDAQDRLVILEASIHADFITLVHKTPGYIPPRRQL